MTEEKKEYILVRTDKVDAALKLRRRISGVPAFIGVFTGIALTNLLIAIAFAAGGEEPGWFWRIPLSLGSAIIALVVALLFRKWKRRIKQLFDEAELGPAPPP